MARTKPKADSRAKGAAYEREVARALLPLTGITFERNLEQSRHAGQGDLTPNDPLWPFLLECKRYAHGRGAKPSWIDQAVRAAAGTPRLWPVVIFRYDLAETRCAVPMGAVVEACGGEAAYASDAWVETSLETLAWFAAEIMAVRAARRVAA